MMATHNYLLIEKFPSRILKCEQGIVLGVAEVGDADAGRVGLAAGPADRDQAHLVAPAPGDERGLDTEAVDAVDDMVIVRMQQSREILQGEEVLDGRDATIGIDLPDTRRHDLHLGHAERVGQGVQLAVDIGFGDMVEIDK